MVFLYINTTVTKIVALQFDLIDCGGNEHNEHIS